MLRIIERAFKSLADRIGTILAKERAERKLPMRPFIGTLKGKFKWLDMDPEKLKEIEDGTTEINFIQFQIFCHVIKVDPRGIIKYAIRERREERKKMMVLREYKRSHGEVKEKQRKTKEEKRKARKRRKRLGQKKI